MSDLAALLGALRGVPLLEGCCCAGRHDLFDPPDSGEPANQVEARQFQALGLCGRCPALAACREYVESLPANQKPTGVVAGTINNPKQKRWSSVREAV